jgi:hypothetical protein
MPGYGPQLSDRIQVPYINPNEGFHPLGFPGEQQRARNQAFEQACIVQQSQYMRIPPQLQRQHLSLQS